MQLLKNNTKNKNSVFLITEKLFPEAAKQLYVIGNMSESKSL